MMNAVLCELPWQRGDLIAAPNTAPESHVLGPLHIHSDRASNSRQRESDCSLINTTKTQDGLPGSWYFVLLRCILELYEYTQQQYMATQPS